MKKSNLEFNKTELDDAAEIEKIMKVLDKQRYPVDVEKYLDSISGEAAEIGWKWVVARAYCFGSIRSKQAERLRMHSKK